MKSKELRYLINSIEFLLEIKTTELRKLKEKASFLSTDWVKTNYAIAKLTEFEKEVINLINCED